MKILLIGSRGQVGQALLATLPAIGTVTAWSRADCDLTQSAQILPQVLAQQPDVIVNAAAYTAVDKAEQEPELAHQINGVAPGCCPRPTGPGGSSVWGDAGALLYGLCV